MKQQFTISFWLHSDEKLWQGNEETIYNIIVVLLKISVHNKISHKWITDIYTKQLLIVKDESFITIWNIFCSKQYWMV